jgi:hypothetical protein
MNLNNASSLAKSFPSKQHYILLYMLPCSELLHDVTNREHILHWQLWLVPIGTTVFHDSCDQWHHTVLFSMYFNKWIQLKIKVCLGRHSIITDTDHFSKKSATNYNCSIQFYFSGTAIHKNIYNFRSPAWYHTHTQGWPGLLTANAPFLLKFLVPGVNAHSAGWFHAKFCPRCTLHSCYRFFN